jgi:hypothetical protein
MVDFCTFIFMHYRIHKTLKLRSYRVMDEFFKMVEASYPDNPYHNSLHAIDVTSSTSFILHCGLGEQLTEFETACLLISCIVHDIGHPGFNNGFMIASQSK